MGKGLVRWASAATSLSRNRKQRNYGGLACIGTVTVEILRVTTTKA